MKDGKKRFRKDNDFGNENTELGQIKAKELMTVTEHKARESFVKGKKESQYEDGGHAENAESFVRKRCWSVRERKPKKERRDCLLKGMI